MPDDAPPYEDPCWEDSSYSLKMESPHSQLVHPSCVRVSDKAYPWLHEGLGFDGRKVS